MMSERVKKAFEECDRFIEESTPEELEEYEKSLGIDYSKYFDSISFSEFISLDCKNNINISVTYSNVSESIGKDRLKKYYFEIEE